MTDATNPNTLAAPAVRRILEQAGLDPKEVDTYATQHGTLSDAHFEALENVGITKTLVGDFIGGLDIQPPADGAPDGAPDAGSDAGGADDGGTWSKFRQEAAEHLGGAEKLDELVDWGTANLSADQQDAVNARLADPATAMQATKDLAAMRDSANRSTGRPAPFLQANEYAKAVLDPKYASDPAYRESIRQRVIVSDENIRSQHNATHPGDLPNAAECETERAMNRYRAEQPFKDGSTQRATQAAQQLVDADPTAQPFPTKGEALKAMNDHRYQHDGTYTQEVDDRLMASGGIEKVPLHPAGPQGPIGKAG